MPTTLVTVPDGEPAKTLAELERLCDQFSDARLSRHDVIVGVGGGATTDLAGFAAGTYLRGIAVAHVATSLVAQVDAAIGGKTAVNLPSGKNLVGVFHQPIGVLCDLDTLATLPERERRCGLGEIAKCWLLEHRAVDELLQTSESVWIENAVRTKARIVSADEREGGVRALLNYGHTLGHALERQALASSSLDLRHGEAVAIGLAFAARLALQLGRVSATTVAATDAVLRALELPGHLPANVDLEALLHDMSRDKKAHHDLTFVLDGPQGFDVVSDLEIADVTMALHNFAKEGS
jgi:5-deoxy-5-amino-3-dehydroquinate synthase